MVHWSLLMISCNTDRFQNGRNRMEDIYKQALDPSESLNVEVKKVGIVCEKFY